MKNVRWILASLSLGLLATACAVPTTESELEETQPGEQTESLKLYDTTTYYFSDAAMSHLVGQCRLDQCDSSLNGCSGTHPTAYHRATPELCGFFP